MSFSPVAIGDPTINQEMLKGYSYVGTDVKNPSGASFGNPLDNIISSSGVRRYGTPDTAGGGAPKPPDEAQIRADMMARVQSAVDSIRNSFASVIAEDRRVGDIQLGRRRALNARSGTLGSDFGDAAMADVEAQNQKVIAAREAEREAKVQAFLLRADERAEEKYRYEREVAEKDRDKYFARQKEIVDEARTDAGNFFKTGASLESLPREEYQRMLEQTGYTPEQLRTISLINRPDDKIISSFAQGNKYFVVSRDE